MTVKVTCKSSDGKEAVNEQKDVTSASDNLAKFTIPVKSNCVSEVIAPVECAHK